MLDDLTQLLFDNAADAGRDVRSWRAQRRDGWTPARVRTFLQTLAQCGIVAEAARMAGISAKSAYALRNSAKGAAFARAWQVALSAGRRLVRGPVQSRVVHGYAQPVIRRGKLWGMRHRFDNPLSMRVLRTLDRSHFGRPPDEEVMRAAEDFPAFIDQVCAHYAALRAGA